ncbi:type VI secretion system contractile sheath large subunit [Bradyrhizobium sp. NAS96.2]|uniref:type VI secretion system contractile sheath domain-containing protein n=1 Tax=Bradyrhizobium sp. NAS96.2 TaxID=1680160 RepID=UPI00093EB015|nr:type VI secretion system contractile sheath large subunit [Bradyrhizobium sp. NAS96.2]OKO70478.1 hypothetical protein AC628_30535 [Bradyrhizobium sp. NAS96.2]
MSGPTSCFKERGRHDRYKPQPSAEVVIPTADVSLLDQILVETKITPHDEGYDLARRGVAAFVAELIKPNSTSEQVNNALVDRMIAEIDRKISAQLDAVLHTDEFQQLKSVWRGLKFMVDRTDFRQNTKIEILSVSKDELLADFEGILAIPARAADVQRHPEHYFSII